MSVWLNFKNAEILLNKISRRFLLTTQLFSVWKILITAVKSLMIHVTFNNQTMKGKKQTQN